MSEVVIVRERAFLARHAPAVLVASAVLAGASLLFLGLLAASAEDANVEASLLTVRDDGMAIQAYGLPTLRSNEAIHATFSFPREAGDAYLLTCTDLARFLNGDAPLGPLLAERGAMSGELAYDASPQKFRAPTGKTPGYCGGHSVAFAWQTGGADWGRNAPLANVVVQARPLDTSIGAALSALGAASALVALVAGVSLASRRSFRAYAPVDDPTARESTLESLRGVADAAVSWLERTRRMLLVAGILGVFLWYPVLIPWAWRVGRDASAQPWAPWALALAALALLAGLTALWARWFLALDRDLARWRERIARLRERETRLLADLDALR